MIHLFSREKPLFCLQTSARKDTVDRTMATPRILPMDILFSRAGGFFPAFAAGHTISFIKNISFQGGFVKNKNGGNLNEGLPYEV
jgi:hypothetical protein